jgi:hypothetical protein
MFWFWVCLYFIIWICGVLDLYFFVIAILNLYLDLLILYQKPFKQTKKIVPKGPKIIFFFIKNYFFFYKKLKHV